MFSICDMPISSYFFEKKRSWNQDEITLKNFFSRQPFTITPFDFEQGKCETFLVNAATLLSLLSGHELGQ